MGAPFDPSQPGAIRLREMARRIRAAATPVVVEIRRPVSLPDDDRHLAPGDRTTVPAGWVDHLVALGYAVRV